MKTSIIITSYNYEKYIAEAIESVIAQTVEDWELIIVDDGSKDNSVEIIKEYCAKDSRIKLFQHFNDANKGLKASILLGLEKTQYDWVVFLESDDCIEPNYLEEKINFVRMYPECGFIYNHVSLFGDKRNTYKNDKYLNMLAERWMEKQVQDVFDEFGDKNIVPTFSCVMCKKDILLQLNYNTPCKPILDYWLWWQAAEKTEFGFINKKLTKWRTHTESYLVKSSKSFRYHMERALFVSEILKILKRTPKLSIVYKMEINKFSSVLMYLSIYFKRKIPFLIKKLFKTR